MIKYLEMDVNDLEKGVELYDEHEHEVYFNTEDIDTQLELLESQ